MREQLGQVDWQCRGDRGTEFAAELLGVSRAVGPDALGSRIYDPNFLASIRKVYFDLAIDLLGGVTG